MYYFIILPPIRQVGFPSSTGPKDHWAHASMGFYNSHWAHYTEVKRDGPQWLFMTFGQVYWTIVTLTKVDQAFGNGRSKPSQKSSWRLFQNTVLNFFQQVFLMTLLKTIKFIHTVHGWEQEFEGGIQWGRRLEGWSNTAARLAGSRRVTQQGVILYVMDGPCRLPWRTTPLA